MDSNNHRLNTPVLFIVFNRLDTTQIVFEAIKKAKPAKFYIASDAARASKPQEAKQVKAVRDYILNNIDWDCEVKTLFRENNLGCKMGVSSAVDWLFENEEEGIILEDDCLPEQSFFPYCQDLLNHYREDERIFIISGTNEQYNQLNIQDSYYFSRFPHIWGWATWKRVWKNYDVTISDFEIFKEKKLISHIFNEKRYKKYWLKVLKDIHNNKIDTWDYQLTYLAWKQNGMTIIPKVNLISNIGFGINATHTKMDTKAANMPSSPIAFPLKHPDFFLINKTADILSLQNKRLNILITNNFILSRVFKSNLVKSFIIAFFSFMKRLRKK